MKLSVEQNTEPTTAATSGAPATPVPPIATDPTAPDLGFLARDFAAALQSFFGTIDRVAADNPVAIGRLQELAGKARTASLTDAVRQELQTLKAQAIRQGRAVGAVIG